MIKSFKYLTYTAYIYLFYYVFFSDHTASIRIFYDDKPKIKIPYNKPIIQDTLIQDTFKPILGGPKLTDECSDCIMYELCREEEYCENCYECQDKL